MSATEENEDNVLGQNLANGGNGGNPPAHDGQEDQSISDIRVPNTGQDTAILPQAEEEGVGTAHDPALLPAFELPELVLEADKNKWTLPQELADNFATYTKLHITDKDWASNMEEYPPPSNVDAVPNMDNNFKRLLKDEGQNAAIDADHDLSNLQRKVEGIMGPLGKAWSECARFKRGEVDKVDVYKVCQQLGMASVAVAHAMQKISYHRRITSLSALG